MSALTEEDFVRILSATRASLTEQYRALLATEEVTIDFTDDGIAALARIAAEVNDALENIGARRLQTVMEKLVEDISFTAEERSGRDAGDRCRLRRKASWPASPRMPTSAATSSDPPAGNSDTSPCTNGDHNGALTPARRRRLATHWLQVWMALALPLPR